MVVSVADYIFAYFRVDSTFALFAKWSQITYFSLTTSLITLKELFFSLISLLYEDSCQSNEECRACFHCMHPLCYYTWEKENAHSGKWEFMLERKAREKIILFTDGNAIRDKREDFVTIPTTTVDAKMVEIQNYRREFRLYRWRRQV